MQPLHISVKPDAIVISCAVSGHEHRNLRIAVVTDRSEHVDLQTLIESLLSAGELTAFVQFWRDTSSSRKPLPDSALLGRN